MRYFLPLAGLISCSFLVSPAVAQTFSGPHIEAVAGWDHADSTSNLRSAKDGFLYGGSAGYDLRRGNLVLGIAGEVTGSTAKDCYDFNGGTVQSGRACQKIGRDLYAGGRVGWVVAPRTLIYGTAGYTNARRTGRFDGLANGQALHISDHDDQSGYRVGAGVEYAVTAHTFVRGEYRYSNYGGRPDIERQQLVTAIGYRF